MIEGRRISTIDRYKQKNERKTFEDVQVKMRSREQDGAELDHFLSDKHVALMIMEFSGMSPEESIIALSDIL